MTDLPHESNGGYSDDPDEVTLQIAGYGTAFSDVIDGNYEIDRMIDYMTTENVHIMERANLDVFDRILSMPGFLKTPIEKVDPKIRPHVTDVKTFLENIEAIDELISWKEELDVWGRYRGTIERAEAMFKAGIPPEIMEMASRVMNKKEIGFKTVREARP